MNASINPTNTSADEQEAAAIAMFLQVPPDDRLQVIDDLRAFLANRAQQVATAWALARDVVSLQFAQREAAFQARPD